MSPGNPLILGSVGQRYELRRGSLHSCECQLLLVTNVVFTDVSCGVNLLVSNGILDSKIITSPPVGWRTIAISERLCLSVSTHISQKSRANFTKFCTCYLRPWLGGRCSSLDTAIHYELQVLWMTLCFHIIGQNEAMHYGSSSSPGGGTGEEV